MKKKLMILILCLSAILLITACGEKPEAAAESKDEAKDENLYEDIYLEGMNLMSEGEFVDACEALYRYKEKNSSDEAKQKVEAALNRISFSVETYADGEPETQFVDTTTADWEDGIDDYIYLVLTDQQTGKKQVAASIKLKYKPYYEINSDSIEIVKNKDDSWLFYVWTNAGATSTFLYTIHSNQLKILEWALTTWNFKDNYMAGESMSFAVGDNEKLFVYDWEGNLLHHRENVIAHCTLEGNSIYFLECDFENENRTYFVRKMDLGEFIPSTLCTIELKSGVTDYVWMEEGVIKWDVNGDYTSNSMSIHSLHDLTL